MPAKEEYSCKVGNTLAKIANFFPWLLHRKGRFRYLNP